MQNKNQNDVAFEKKTFYSLVKMTPVIRDSHGNREYRDIDWNHEFCYDCFINIIRKTYCEKENISILRLRMLKWREKCKTTYWKIIRYESNEGYHEKEILI